MIGFEWIQNQHKTISKLYPGVWCWLVPGGSLCGHNQASCKQNTSNISNSISSVSFSSSSNIKYTTTKQNTSNIYPVVLHKFFQISNIPQPCKTPQTFIQQHCTIFSLKRWTMCWMATTQRCLHTEQQVRLFFPSRCSPKMSPNVFLLNVQCFLPLFPPKCFLLRVFHSRYNKFPMLSPMFPFIFSQFVSSSSLKV